VTAEPHALLEAHFAGRTTADEDRQMWRHLPGCAECRARYRALTLLESLEPEGEDQARARMGRALFAPRPARKVVWGGAFVAAAAAAAATVLVVAWPRDEFRPRGGEAPALPSAARPALEIFRFTPGASAGERVGSVIRAGDGLAFGYVNPPAVAATHLAVFVAEPGGRLHWFWPAWKQPQTNPTAVPIRMSDTLIELPEEIRHELRPGPLTLHALFARRPYGVRELEAAAAAGKLAALDGVLVSERLEVTP
jgi:hypothetical protein